MTKENIRAAFKDIFSLENDTADLDTIKERIISGGQITGTNMCILVLAIFIASIGLNMNSTAVIIGAMLISPLMGSILAIAYGVATVDVPLIQKSAIGFIVQIAICLITSTIYFMLSPISATTSELLARTQPTVWDVLIATFGGLAGIIGITRTEKSNVIPGVAIATALMPPLCTCGYGLATRQWDFFFGAFYLFVVNSYFICLSSLAILLLVKVPKQADIPEKVWKKLKKRILKYTLVMIIPSMIFAYNMVVANGKDATSTTGFQTNVSVDSISKQIELLYPSVTHVQIGYLQEWDKETDTVNEKQTILLSVDKELSVLQMRTLSKWMNEVYGEDISITQQLE